MKSPKSPNHMPANFKTSMKWRTETSIRPSDKASSRTKMMIWPSWTHFHRVSSNKLATPQKGETSRRSIIL